MVRLYRSGLTLQQIGDAFQLTRERVRQLIKRYGITGKDGGVHTLACRNAEARRAAQHARRDARALMYYGCTYDELIRLNSGIAPRVVSSAAGKFRQQKNNALTRKVAWAITFPQWMAIWAESGHWNERARRRDGYVMGRKGDTGPYAMGNVYITTMAGNVSDYQASLKRRGVECADGYRRLPEKKDHYSTRQNGSRRTSTLGTGRGWTLIRRSKKNPYQVVVRNHYIGMFPTQSAAEAAYAAAVSELKAA